MGKKVQSIDQSIDDIVGFLYEADSARELLRGMGQRIGVIDLTDNVAAHSYVVTMCGWVVAKMEGLSDEEVGKVLQRGLLHDLNETRFGEHHWVQQQYIVADEGRASDEQLAQLPFGEELREEVRAYEKRETVVDRVVKDGDLLATIMYVRKQAVKGNQEAKRWLDGRAMYNKLTTNSGKRLADEIYKQRPFAWQDKVLPKGSKS